MQPDAPLAPPVVLVVEDESLVRMVVVDMLEDAGFAVIEASHADAAWTVLEAEHAGIAVLFTDIDMPGSMDGIGLAERVSTNWPHIRLVITSGRHWLRNEDMPDAGQFVHKPYHPSQIVRAIANAG